MRYASSSHPSLGDKPFIRVGDIGVDLPGAGWEAPPLGGEEHQQLREAEHGDAPAAAGGHRSVVLAYQGPAAALTHRDAFSFTTIGVRLRVDDLPAVPGTLQIGCSLSLVARQPDGLSEGG